MELQEAVKSGFDNLTNFESRATRSEFWWYWAAIAVPAIILSMILSSFLPPSWGRSSGWPQPGSPSQRPCGGGTTPDDPECGWCLSSSDLLVYTRDLHRPVFGGLGAGASGELCGSGHPASRGLGGAVLFGPAQRYRLQPVRSAAGIARLRPPRKGSPRGTTMRTPSKS